MLHLTDRAGNRGGSIACRCGDKDSVVDRVQKRAIDIARAPWTGAAADRKFDRIHAVCNRVVGSGDTVGNGVSTGSGRGVADRVAVDFSARSGAGNLRPRCRQIRRRYGPVVNGIAARDAGDVHAVPGVDGIRLAVRIGAHTTGGSIATDRLQRVVGRAKTTACIIDERWMSGVGSAIENTDGNAGAAMDRITRWRVSDCRCTDQSGTTKRIARIDLVGVDIFHARQPRDLDRFACAESHGNTIERHIVPVLRMNFTTDAGGDIVQVTGLDFDQMLAISGALHIALLARF